MTTRQGWQHFDHMADIGVRGIGENLSQAFEQTALAMIAVITDPALIKPLQAVSINCEAPDLELLLTSWLNAVIFEIATRNMLFSRFQVNIQDITLTATAWGEPINSEKHQPAVEVKGATFTRLKVEQTPNGNFIAQCVVDV